MKNGPNQAGRRPLIAELEERVQLRTAELTATLREREVLLQEVHHWVKNNLQVISSLINMQVRALGTGASRDALVECEARVHAVALIQERLYKSIEVEADRGTRFSVTVPGRA